MKRREFLTAIPAVSLVGTVEVADAASVKDDPRKIEAEFGPRDMLVVSSAYHISSEMADRLRERLEEAARDPTRKVLVLGSGLSLQILKRP